MTHYYYDRFDPPDGERYGKWSVNFGTNAQGDVDKALMSLDEAEATFTRRPETLDANVLKQLAGTYETPTGAKFQVVLKEDGGLFLLFPGAPEQELVPYKGLKFRIPEFSGVVYEFLMENGQAKALKQRDPSGNSRSLKSESELSIRGVGISSGNLASPKPLSFRPSA